jgi:hypothetical protein
VTARVLVLGLVVAIVGCSTAVPIQSVAELAGEWKGRASGPAGHAPVAMVITPDGAFTGTMFLIGADRTFGGALVVVRPGEVRYQGTDGNGAVRVVEEEGRRVLKFLRDGGGGAAVFRQF